MLAVLVVGGLGKQGFVTGIHVAKIGSISEIEPICTSLERMVAISGLPPLNPPRRGKADPHSLREGARGREIQTTNQLASTWGE